MLVLDRGGRVCTGVVQIKARVPSHSLRSTSYGCTGEVGDGLGVRLGVRWVEHLGWADREYLNH